MEPWFTKYGTAVALQNLRGLSGKGSEIESSCDII